MAELYEGPFIDAQAMHGLYPDTFDVPSQKRLDRLRSSDGVRLGFVTAMMVDGCSAERMWVTVTKCCGEGWYQGILRSHPVILSLEPKTMVKFHQKHIMAVY